MKQIPWKVMLIALVLAAGCTGPVEDELQQAETMAREGRLNEALGVYREIIQQEPGNAAALRGAGEILLRLKRPEEALEMLEKVESLQEADYELLVMLGRTNRGVGKTGRALEVYEKAISLDPDRGDAQMGKGLALLSQGRLNEAEAPLKEAQVLGDTSAEALMALGRVAAKKGHHLEAVAWYNKAGEQGADKGVVWLRKGISLAQLGRQEEAETALKTSAEEGNIEALRQLGQQYYQQERWEESVEVWQRLLDKRSGDEMALALLEDCRSHLKSREEK
jgi:tetratricopeptide (TPR) repeat protein